VFYGDGHGSFSSGPVLSIGNVGAVPLAMVAGDFNEDGTMDLAVAGGNQLYVFLGTGGGSFTGTPLVFPVLPAGQLALAMDAADFDRDGHLDLVMGNYSAGPVAVLLGDGHGNFGAPITFDMGSQAGDQHVHAVDVNGDGLPDIVAGSG